MTIVKSKSGRRVKHTNKGQFGKKSKSGFNLGLMHIWVLAFGNINIILGFVMTLNSLLQKD